MSLQVGCLFSGLHYLGKAKENLQTQELFLKEGSLGEEHGGGKESPSNGHSVSLSTVGLFFPPHHLSQLTSTSTVGPKWMWTLSQGIGPTGGVCGSVATAVWWEPGRRRGGRLVGRRPPRTQPHILCASRTTMKTVTMNQLCCREAPWNLHIRFPSSWHPQVVVSGSIKQRFGTNPWVPQAGGDCTGWAEALVRMVFKRELKDSPDGVCKGVRASVLRSRCVQCLLSHLQQKTVARRSLGASRMREIHSARNSNTNTSWENELIHLDNVLSLRSCKKELHINTTLKIRGPTV